MMAMVVWVIVIVIVIMMCSMARGMFISSSFGLEGKLTFLNNESHVFQHLFEHVIWFYE